MTRVRIAVIGASLALSSQSTGALNATVVTDTTEFLSIEWTWTPVADDTSTPTLTNWEVTLSTLSPLNPEGVGTISITARHKSAPHGEAEDGEDGGEPWDSGLFVLFANERREHNPELDLSGVSDHGWHHDEYQFSFLWDPNPQVLNPIKLQATHSIPAPLTNAPLIAFAWLGTRRRARH